MYLGRLLPINEISQVGEARRLIQTLAQEIGFDVNGQGRAALLMSEIAHNTLLHGGGGEILLHVLEQGARRGLEILSIDQGPGMFDIEACLRDGFSTKGTQGTGLGTIARQADKFELNSDTKKGVVLSARLWSRPAEESSNLCEDFTAIQLAYPGESVSGDAWGAFHQSERSIYVIADGLGHGPAAAEASLEAINVVHENQYLKPKPLLGMVHLALRRTRGAAVAIAEIDHVRNTLTFGGIGNIAGKVFTHESVKGCISHDGTAGYLSPKTYEYEYPWSSQNILVMHSDGLSSRSFMTMDKAIHSCSSSLIAAWLLRDCKRVRDDQTLLVVKGRRDRSVDSELN